MKSNTVMVRLDEADYELLTKEAGKTNISRPEFLRTLLHERFAAYDPNHEALVRQIVALGAAVADVHELSAVTAGLLAALEISRLPNARANEMTGVIEQGFQISEAVLLGQKRGLFKKAGG